MEVWIRQGMAYRCRTDGPMPFPVPGWMWDRKLGLALYDQRMRYIRRVEELGFDGIIFTEHHYGPNGGLTPSPSLMVAAATQVTERIKLVTMGIILALHAHPVRVAEEVAMLDNLSHGRLVAGFVSGNTMAHYAYGVPPHEARARHEEAFALIRRAWTDENPFPWDGQYYRYDCVSILPRPLQTPHPPVWTTAWSAESIEWAARNRLGYITSGTVAQASQSLAYFRDYAQRECGWTPTAADCGLARELVVLPTEAKAREFAERLYVRDRQDAYSDRFEPPELAELERRRYTQRSYEYLGNLHGGGRMGNFRERAGRDFDEMRRNGQFLVGDPDSVAEQILDQGRALGTNVLVLRPEIGGLSLDAALDTLELFAREVLPVIQTVDNSTGGVA